jgi:hypothetical protein
LIFNPEAQVAENLFNFGNQLNDCFQRVVEATTHGKTQRQRIFLKVKEKLDDEIAANQRQKEEMIKIQQELAEQKVAEKAEQERQKQLAIQRKQRELEEQKIRDEQRRERNTILEALEREKKAKAKELLNTLMIKGFKKIGKDKIKDLEADPEKIDYDTVIEFYQGVLRKEREQAEEDKKKKLREVELWTRALREEEKIAIQNYAENHGDKEME